MLSHFGLFMLRRPLLAVDQLEQFHRTFLEEKSGNVLKNWYLRNPQAREAIYLASVTLYERFAMWLADMPVSEADKLEITLYKYLVRTSTRCTPYGFFAVATTGTIEPATLMQIKDGDNVNKHTRLDMETLTAIKDWLTRQPGVRMQLSLFVNSSLYRAAGDYHYVEQVLGNRERTYFMSALESNEYIDLILGRAQHGATIQELTNLLEDLSFDSAESSDFIDELIENKILLFDIEPTVTGIGYLDSMIQRISLLNHTHLLTGHLLSLREILSDQENRGRMYEKLNAKLDFLGIAAVKKEIVHVDTVVHSSVNQLSENVVSKISEQIESLFAMNRPKKNPELEAFQQAFENRYQQREGDLTSVLDHLTGIGYGIQDALGTSYTPVIDELSFTANPSDAAPALPEWWQNLLLEKYAGFLKQKSSEIDITDSDLGQIKIQKERQSTRKEILPYSFYLLGNLLAESSENLDQGDFLFNLLTASGPSASNILSRFHEADPALGEKLTVWAKQEEAHSPDVIFAEIVHFPDSSAGNIMTRPVLHAYEIPYMGTASVTEDFQIPIQDLMVSVQSGQIILRSKRLNKRVIPRLSNAHNFTNGLPIYRFLGALQSQHSQLNLQWDWAHLKSQAFLPRVRYKNIILARASWLLNLKDLKTSDPDIFITKLRDLGVPSQFIIASADNELQIDITNALSVQIVMQEIVKRKELRVMEVLFSSDNTLLSQNGERYSNEIVVPLFNEKTQPIQGLAHFRAAKVTERSFSVGSEWLYFKIYSAEKSSDKILASLLPLIEDLAERNLVDKFFFVRYFDPEHHIRLRLHGDVNQGFYHQTIDLLKTVFDEYVQSRLIYKVQLDTYERELERYGNDQIETCETLFHLDSINFLQTLSLSEDGLDENAKLELAFSRVNELLINSGLSIAECCQLLAKLKENFFDEFNGDSHLRKQLGQQYRNFRAIIEQTFMNSAPEKLLGDYLSELSGNLDSRNEYFSVLSSIIHMSINRVFHAKQRAYELVLYHCLERYYDSIKARQQKSLA